MIKKLVCTIAWRKRRKIIKEYCAIDNITEDEIEKIQLEKINRLLVHYKEYGFYSKLLSSVQLPLMSIDALKALPIIGKEIIRANEAEIKERACNAKRHSTSGSTGQNFWFYIDENSRDTRNANKWFIEKKIGLQFGYKSIGIWGGNVKKKEDNQIINRLKTYFTNTILLPGYGLTDDIAQNYLSIINSKKPDMLYGYPSYLSKISEVGLANNIEIDFRGVIVTSGEQLLPNQRETIEKYFGTTVLNRYGSVEFGMIGHQISKFDKLFVNPLRYILECDEENTLLVTDLDNYATPFIRYIIGDKASISRDGNWIVINELMGRSNDVITTPSGKMIPSQFWTILSRYAEDIRNFQIRQTTLTDIEMNVIAPHGTDFSEIIDNFNKSFGDEMNLHVCIVDGFELTDFGKQKFVIKLKGEK